MTILSKKSQITVFLIIGLVLVITFSLLYYLQSLNEDVKAEAAISRTSEVPLYLQPIKNQIESCLYEVSAEAVNTIGLHAGFIDALENPRYGESGCYAYIDYNYTKIPYSIINYDNSYLLPLENITKRIRHYIAVEMPRCIESSSDFFSHYDLSVPDINYTKINFNFSKATVNYSTHIVNVTLKLAKNSMIVDLQYPFQVATRSARTDLLRFHTSFEVAFGALYNNISNFAYSVASSPSYNLSEHCDEYSIAKRIFLVNNSIVGFVVNNPSSDDYIFQFAFLGTDIFGEC